MDEPSAQEHKHSSLNRDSSSSNHLEEDEKTISEGSISEHLTSASASVENDRSLHEIEISNNPSALANSQQESKDYSLDLSSFGGYVSNGLPDNKDQKNNSDGTKNVRSILDEILSNSEFHSNTEGSKEESFNLFANLDLSDKSLINLSDNAKDGAIARSLDLVHNNLTQLDEMMAVKDSVPNALSQELDSFREMSNPTCMSSMVSATEYKQLQDECHAKLLEYNSAINYKNDLIQQLSESLRQSVTQQKELNEQVENFKEQITQLQLQLQETSKMMENHQCALPKSVPDTCSNDLDSKHETEQIVSIKDYQNLMELKLEVEKKHAKEMEELRTYFEKKCTELEKNYSEEIFSQHSRKLSDSSSEVELSADYLLSSQPGPGGDLKRVFKSKEDVKRLLDNLNSFVKKLSKHSLEEINDKGLTNIEIEVKNELNALFKIGEKLEIQAVESKYKEEISNLKFQLEEEGKRHANLSMGSVIQEVVSPWATSGDYELMEVVESYERRLQEQIANATIDIIKSLAAQIQRLASNEADDEDWPPELLQLRDKFTQKHEAEIQDLRNQHEAEVAKLKDEHLKMLNGALERGRRRRGKRSLKEEDSLTKADVELLKERDNLKRQVCFQRNLLTELIKYFLEAEDELNNTLVENLIKQSNETLLDPIEEPDNSSGATTANSSKIFDSISNKARVHFAPNIRELLDMIEHQSQHEDESLDVSVELKNELGMCLEKLKQEANAILALSCQPKKCDAGTSLPEDLEARLQSVTKQLLVETQRNSNLKSELFDANQIITSLEKDKECLESRVEQLLERVNMFESELSQAKTRIADLIEGRNSEVVSEGYGEAGHSMMHGLDDTTAALTALQEKAQTMLEQSRASVNPDVLQLIEELCRVSETVKEEAKKESKDLLQQIEAADKKYKTTQQFLEEQAAEREQERDEAQRQIDSLHNQLKDRDKDRVNCQIMSKEADQLEQRIADLNNHLTDQQIKYKELESERDEAVEKIKILRDIIRELEQVNDAKDRDLEEHLRQVERLECIVNEQRATFDEYTSRSSFGDVSDVQKLRQHCEQLEEEVQKLRIGAELAGSEGALKQLKLQIFEIEASLDKKTKALELLHSSGTSCSSPSEDMSVRDLVRPQTTVMDECEVPLQQLARLKEKLLRHSRAEEAAIKRIHDLEMELTGLKNELEEVGNEKEVMKRQIQEQVVLISDFQIRLDQQRIKAEHIERQTNTSLETKIYDQQNEISHLQEKLRSREKALAHHEQMVEQLGQRVKELEEELANPKEDEIIVELQKQLDALRMENQILREKPSSESQILPSLMENILQDKNSDIEKLKAKLAETERQLLSYTSLNLDRNDLKTLAELKNSGGSIEQLISILDLSSPAVDRARHCVNESASLQKPMIFRKNEVTESLDCSSLPEISSIQRTGNNLNYTTGTPFGKPNSTELSHRSAGKRVRFETSESNIIESLTNELETLKLELENKNKTISELEAKLRVLHDLEEQIGRLQSRLDETEAALVKATETFEKEKEDSLETQQKLGVELAEKKLTIERLEKEVQALKDDSVRKDEMHLNLAREKRDLEEQFLSQKRESYDNLNRALDEKNLTIQNLLFTQKTLQAELQQALTNLSESLSQVEKLKNQMSEIEQRSAAEINDFKMELVARNNCIQQMQSDFNDQIATLKSTIEELGKQVTEKDTKIKDSACEIDILNEDLKYYQNELTEITEKLKQYESPEIERQEVKLTKEVNHLQELIREKDRMIAQMTEDHNTVHAKLEVVNHKISETGNIFDLSKRLRQEQKKNADLHASIQKLKAALWNYEVEVATAAPMEEIAGQVKRELECAAQIDSNILNAVSDQSLSSISEGQDTEVYMKALTRQKNQNKQLMRNNDRLEKQRLALEQKCNQFELRVNEMQNELDKERLHNRRVMIEDAKLMEQLRLKLEASVDFQKALEKLLEEEKRCRRMLEIKCEELKKPTSSSESTKYKSLPTQDRLEVEQLKKDLESVKEEKNKWCKEVKTLRLENDELKSDIKYAQQMLALETERNRAHEEKFRVLAEKEKNLNDELLKKRFELEVKEREMEEKKIKMDELEQEKTVLEKQKSKLVKVLKTQSQVPKAPLEGAQLVPEQLANVIAELKQKSDENKKRLEHIEKIEKEKAELEKQLRAEVKKNVEGNMPYADLVARCDYLFAKSLKLESVRKALTWQKRYLVDYVKSYQTQFSIGILPNQPHDTHCLRHRHSPLTYFRAAVHAVISIHRMKFLVRRWHTGKRKYDKINARHYRNSTEQYLRENQGANFQVGQPVSNQIFFQNVNTFNPNNPFRLDSYHDESRTVSPALSAPFILRDIPWSGNSPPSKDYQHSRIGARETYAPLRAPELLTQLHERVEQVQERLSLPLRADPT